MKKLTFLLIPILITIAIVEFFLILKKPNFIELDKELGWKVKSNFNHSYNQTDLVNKKYKANFKTDKYGMRNFHTDSEFSSEIKIFVFGDSFTSDPYASNDKMWFSEITKKIAKNYKTNASVYSIGAGGYGNLQQLLSIKKLKKNGFEFDEMDLIIFQFCNNDFINNSLRIEKKLNVYNQYTRRPYLRNNKIIFDNSLISWILRTSIIGDSRIINKFFFLLSKIEIRKKNNIDMISENDIKTTKKIISMIKNEFPNKELIMINCDIEENWQTKVLNEIVDENNFVYFNFPKVIKSSPKFLYKDGSHLSELGNKFFGEYLFKNIIKNQKLSSLF